MVLSGTFDITYQLRIYISCRDEQLSNFPKTFYQNPKHSISFPQHLILLKKIREYSIFFFIKNLYEKEH